MFFGIPPETPLDLRFRLFGVPVRVHPVHWVVGALLGWDFIRAGFAYVLVWVVCVFLSVLLHEMGHVLVGRLFGSDGYIVLFSLGGVAIGSSDLRKRWQRILVYLAGPAFQIVLYGTLRFATLALVERTPPNWQLPIARTCGMLLYINWVWPIFNLFPIWPLDGGRISREVLEAVAGQKGVVASLWVSIVLTLLLAIQALANTYAWRFLPYGEVIGGGMWLAIFFLYFGITSFQALQMERNRHRWEDELPWER